jgi:GNAT superfamily N-acetyltransferase
MAREDLPGAVAASAAAFGLELNADGNLESWGHRVGHPFETDPDGCFVAERNADGAIVGLSQALKRERLWVLSMLTVSPDAQGTSAGRSIFDAARGYADGTDYGLIVSSADPRALHLYAGAGFGLRPALDAVGRVDRNRLAPPPSAIEPVSEGELDQLADISRVVRGGPHTSELRFAIAQGWPVLRHGDRGFAVVAPQFSRIWLLVARDEEAARSLLEAGLALLAGYDEVGVRWIAGGQDWAVETALAAGLRLKIGAAIAVRGDPGPLRPYLPSGPFG